jgi:hypothetical protein
VLPDEVAVTPEWAVRTATDMLADGRPFHAHEVLEAAWKTGPEAERDLWQGLAQVAVGLTHALRGNERGAAALLRRGGARLSGYAGTSPHGIDVDGVLAQAAGLAAEIERLGLAAVPPGRLRVRLTG